MFERDFILRMIKQLAQALRQILNYKKEGQWQNAQMVIDVSIKQLLSLNPIIIDKLDADALVGLFTYDDEIDHKKCLTLASLLTEQASVFENTNQSAEKIFRLYQIGFQLYKTAFIDENLIDQAYLNYALHCCDKLTEFDIETDLLIQIFQFFNQHNSFANAENILFQLLKQNEEQAKKHALKFYTKLLKHDDKILMDGNLPRDEVIEGLAKFTG